MNTRRWNRSLSWICILALLLLQAPLAVGAPLGPAEVTASDSLPRATAAAASPPPAVEASAGRYAAGTVLVRFIPSVGLKLALCAPDKAATTGVISLDRLGTRYGLRAATPVFRQAARQKTLIAQAGLSPQADFGDIYKLTFPADVDVEEVVAAYAADPTVVYAEPDYVFEFDGAPNDLYFDQQWHLHNTGQYYLVDADIDAPEAWDIVTGTEALVIAVIDTGVDRDHPDLAERIWVNPGETPGDGIDNDGNGYTDDTWGWNWVSDVSDPDDYEFNDPRDDNGHGTHVAGIAAAATNNATGVAGVCWNCRVMALKAFESNGVGRTSDIVQAINYAASKGAHVINMSFGSYAESLLLEDTLAAAYGQAVLVAAAGNYGRTLYANVPYYPASYPYVLGVGATDVGCVMRDKITLACLLVDEHRADFSNYGVNADVGAPGVSIYSTFRGGGYASLSGTSMATPMVSGLAALLLSHNPTWSKEMARGQIIKSAEPIYTGEFGRVNAYNALTVIPTPDLAMLSDSIVYGDAAGDADGVPDAGETFSITTLLKNYWGKALTTTAVLSTSDPYVTLVEDTATFGDISAYATMRNTATPFLVTLDSSAPNNHQVGFDLDITADGGAYNTSASFSFLVQRGIEIPHALFPAVITQNMTLYNDYLYIVKQNMLVAEGVTLTIEPGTRLQFDADRFIKIEGTLVASGTVELPIYFTSNQKEPEPGDFKGIVFGDTAIDAQLNGTPLITTVVASGDPTPLGGEFITFTTPAMMNEVGDIAFGATISGAITSEGLFYWLRGHVQPIITAGETAPDSGGATYTGFHEVLMDNAGNVTFLADLSDGGQGIFVGNELGVDKIVATGDVVLDGATPLTLTTFNYVTPPDSLGNIAFRATYWLTDSQVTTPDIIVYRPAESRLYSAGRQNGNLFGAVIDVGRPSLGEASNDVGDVYFTLEGSLYTGVMRLYFWNDADRYDVYGSRRDGHTLASGDVMSFGIYDYVIPTTEGAWFTTRLNATDRAIVDCGLNWQCDVSGRRVLSDSDPAPDSRTLNFAGTIPYISTGLEIVYNANLSGTAEMNYGIVMSDTNELVSLVEEGEALPGGGTVAAIANVSILPHASKLGTVVAVVDVAGGAPGEERLLHIDPDRSYVGGSILNHVVLEYGGGLLVEDSFPYIANSTFRHNDGTTRPGVSIKEGVVIIERSRTDKPQTLIFSKNTLTDNLIKSLWVRAYSATGRFSLVDNTVQNNNINMDPYRSQEGAGIVIAGDPSAIAILRGNNISYNAAYYIGGAGLYLSNNSYALEEEIWTLVERNHFFSNLAPSAPGGYCYDGTGAVRINSGYPILRFNQFGNNVDVAGYNTGEYSEDGGSAIGVMPFSLPTIQYNTLVGNEARSNPGISCGHPELGHTVFSYGGFDFKHNNIVGNTASYDLYLSNFGEWRLDMDATQNFWGTTNSIEIQYDRIFDYWTDFEPGEAVFQPFLATPEPLAPGFLLDTATSPPDPIGAETMTVTLDFSRNMDTAITPTVTFGVDEPYTQHRIENGQWISPTRWVGSFDISLDTGDGINTFRVSDAKDSDGMGIPEDTRFSFVIQTAGTQSILLEAAAAVSRVALIWTQNDVTDLAGYILYRSPYTNTGYMQIGGGMFVDTAYTDTDVTNGVTYYYKYSVLDTDFNEVAWSNEVSVTPDDYTLPTTPVVTDDGAATNYFDRLHASWSAADLETGIAEYQVCVGTAEDNCYLIGWTAMGLATAQTWTGLNLADGAIYYVNVRARNTADHWSAIGSSDGITVDKLPAPVIAAVEPITGVRSVAHVITLTGNGFQAAPAPTVRLGSTTLAGVSVVDATRLTAQVPAGIAAGIYTVTVTNFDTQIASLARAYTATNPIVGPRPLLFSPNPRLLGDDETSTTIDAIVQDVSDLAAFQFDVVYDPAIVQVSDVTLGWFLGSGGRTTTALGPQIDNGAGRVTFGGISYGAAPGAEGSGTLATLTFTPQTTGTTSLNFANVQLRDSLNSEIHAELQSGQIWVVQYPFGDLDRDCDVDVNDIMQVAWRWMDPANYDARYDFDTDGNIDVADIMQVAAAWGDVCVGGPSMQVQSYALDGPLLRLTGPAVDAIRAGDVFTVALQVEGAADLAAYQLELAYNPTYMAVVDVSYTDLLSFGGNTVTMLGPAVDASGGRVTLAGFGYGGARGVDGNGTLALVQMRALERGSYSLDSVAAILVNQNGVLVMPAALIDWSTRGGMIYLPLVIRER